MKKHVSFLLFTLCLSVSAKSMTMDLSNISIGGKGPPVGASFAEYKEWLDSAPEAEKIEHFNNMSANYTEKHGEKANEMRLCLNVDQQWKGKDNWIDQRWASTGIRFLDEQRYRDWVYNARSDDKPWLIMFAYTPNNMPDVVQPADNMMHNLGCLATVFNDTLNIGYMDFRGSEKVFEVYDVKLDWGKTTPALIIFDKGHVYPAQPGTLSAHKLVHFVENFTEDCQNCHQRIKPPASELSLYLEYAKAELANSNFYVDGYNYLHDNLNETWPWFHEEVMAPYFGPKQGRKAIGERLIFWIIVPVVLNSLFFLWLLSTCLCNCCCGSKSKDTSEQKGSKKDGPASAEAEKKQLEAKKAQEILQQAKKVSQETAATSAKTSTSSKRKSKGGKKHD